MLLLLLSVAVEFSFAWTLFSPPCLDLAMAVCWKAAPSADCDAAADGVPSVVAGTGLSVTVVALLVGFAQAADVPKASAMAVANRVLFILQSPDQGAGAAPCCALRQTE
ncbi:MAG: hypothetical protein C0489_02765 [Candidatus Accumulibacter sp.]|nr:hypothetical protein [Accumulibacter sp.]MBA4092989.1 hypothetical protein [Accumulibacter sp.]